MFIYNLDASDYTELLSSVANWTYFRKEKMHNKMITTTEYVLVNGFFLYKRCSFLNVKNQKQLALTVDISP